MFLKYTFFNKKLSFWVSTKFLRRGPKLTSKVS